MAVNAVSAASSSNQTLNLQDFLKILLTQLQYQDPLKPMDNQQFMAQMAQFSTLQQTQQLTDRIDQLLSIQSATQSIGLLGRTVEVGSADGNVSGQVTSLSLTDGAPSLSLKLPSGQVLTGIGLSQIVSVK
jgi:flagellar basal-body rod modification protein FlgD